MARPLRARYDGSTRRSSRTASSPRFADASTTRSRLCAASESCLQRGSVASRAPDAAAPMRVSVIRNQCLSPRQRRVAAEARLGTLLRVCGERLDVPARAGLSVRLTDDAELRDLRSEEHTSELQSPVHLV